MHSGIGSFNSDTEPAFTDDGYNTALYEGEYPNETFLGNWVPTSMPVRKLSYFRFPLPVTEVGFIGRVNGHEPNTSALPPHQQRVLDEKQELDIRITRLDEFILRSALFR
ncbi:MAG: hypothetical protein ACN6OS_21830 [Comamonas testosteroni]|uniref:crAss001_48 related protein n=1 Tax=Comamonas testosteroni TaxID=285 RepID=UPI003D0BF606